MAPYLSLMTAEVPQQRHELREVSNTLRWIGRAGAPWRLLPTNFPPWDTVYQQTRRLMNCGDPCVSLRCFQALRNAGLLDGGDSLQDQIGASAPA